MKAWLARWLGPWLDAQVGVLTLAVENLTVDCDIAVGQINTLTAERDTARTEADAIYTDLVGVSDELAEARAELDTLRAAGVEAGATP